MPNVQLGDVAIESRETCKGDKTGLPAVGLEHLVSGEITLSSWASGAENTFTRLFRKGDMLFGRRRAYLKKAAQAPFDGVCSGDITVIRAKADLLVPELLPFIIQNDALFDFAAGRSAGSLSPRVKWESLREYTFFLPPAEEQRKLAEALWSIEDTLQAYRRLIQETENLVRAQFSEMFGDPMTNSKRLPSRKYGELFALSAGGTPSKKHPEYWEGGTISWIGSNLCHDKVLYQNDGACITEEGLRHSSARIFPPDTVLIALVGATIGRTALLKFETATNQNVLGIREIREAGFTPEYVFYHTQAIYGKFLERGAGFFMAPKGFIGQLDILCADLAAQEHFSRLAEQAEKSKSALHRAMVSLLETRRSLVSTALAGGRKE